MWALSADGQAHRRPLKVCGVIMASLFLYFSIFYKPSLYDTAVHVICSSSFVLFIKVCIYDWIMFFFFCPYFILFFNSITTSPILYASWLPFLVTPFRVWLTTFLLPKVNLVSPTWWVFLFFVYPCFIHLYSPVFKTLPSVHLYFPVFKQCQTNWPWTSCKRHKFIWAHAVAGAYENLCHFESMFLVGIQKHNLCPLEVMSDK